MNILELSLDSPLSLEGAVITLTDTSLTPSLAKRTCARYNEIWSGNKKYTPKGYLVNKSPNDVDVFQKSVDNKLSVIVGYVYTEKTEMTVKEFISLLKKQC